MLDFAARCQGAGEGFAGYMKDLTRLEKERGIRPSPEIDRNEGQYHIAPNAASVSGEKHSVSTAYVLRVLGLDMLQLDLSCVARNPESRPKMEEVARIIEDVRRCDQSQQNITSSESTYNVSE
ncbi:unnamed protein product [Arabidopsis arenosa]|uniref:Uncharacterized protein n=1 Tax=Arabidopsis arenosa TaxID=38785 RepID=A0A8S1ZY53_ARAAE|nr:unnamed protein product [Arabidopsis arenosa]CAE6228066.1 unnamed protein product [Arabidopsis arenosa]